MPAIVPFRALRYNPTVAGELTSLIAPPYDVISSEEQERLYAASPYNVIRLIYGRQRPDDGDRDNRYTRAAETFRQWRERGVLAQDEAPAVYLYEHAFSWEGRLARRLGVVALIAFEGSVPEGVLRHESTFAEPKADRAKLLDAVRANLSPVFGIVPDPGLRLHHRLEAHARGHSPSAVASAPPSSDRESAGTAQGEEVRAWAIQEPELIAEVQRHLAATKMLIADGHHRFEVALSRREIFDAVMTHLSFLEDPAVVIRPIHRIVRIPAERRSGWRPALERLCLLRPCGSLEEVTAWLSRESAEGRFGYHEAGRFYQALVRPEAFQAWMQRPTVPSALAGLDVILLHQLILARLTQQPSVTSTSETLSLCRYTPEPSRAVAMVGEGQGDCAWLLRHTPLATVYELAAQGLTLPQKSTYFYPKVLSGFFINPFDASPAPSAVAPLRVPDGRVR